MNTINSVTKKYNKKNNQLKSSELVQEKVKKFHKVLKKMKKIIKKNNKRRLLTSKLKKLNKRLKNRAICRTFLNVLTIIKKSYL